MTRRELTQAEAADVLCEAAALNVEEADGGWDDFSPGWLLNSADTAKDLYQDGYIIVKVVESPQQEDQHD